MPESGETLSLWQSQILPRPTTPLDADARCDVCVVGAGIAGLTTAYLLALQGRSVIVLDDGPIGGGATLRTTGHLCNALDDRYWRLERWHGPEGARLAAQSHSAAIDRIEAIVDSERIDCDFRRLDGYLVTGDPAQGSEELERELEAARRAGIEADMSCVPSDFDFGMALRFPRQARFHAGKYLDGLAAAAQRVGVRIASPMHMTDIEDGRPARIATTAGVQIDCDAAIVATNTPVIDRLLIHTKQAACRTYVIAARVPRGDVADYLLWDTLDPYHYVRTQPGDDGGDWLIVGGEDHKTGQPDDEDPGEAPFERLQAWARARFATMGVPEFRWSGQVLEPHDGLAFIGRNPMDASNVFVATGDSGNGLTHGTIAGMLLADLVAGRENPWATLYDPSRKSMLTVGTFLRENLNFASQYRDFATPGEVDDPEAIEPGQGALLRRGATKHALYRDKRGTLHELSAICPHLGCLVHWNGVEKTWDCPCHGSRFAAEDGHVLNGPANRGLTVIESFRAAG